MEFFYLAYFEPCGKLEIFNCWAEVSTASLPSQVSCPGTGCSVLALLSTVLRSCFLCHFKLCLKHSSIFRLCLRRGDVTAAERVTDEVTVSSYYPVIEAFFGQLVRVSDVD